MSERKKPKYNKKFNILIIIAIIYIIYAIINLISKPTDVFVIDQGKVSQEEATIGYIIRDETVVKDENSNDKIVAVKSEGEKVAKDEPIFRYYSSVDEEITSQIEEINKKLNEELKNQTGELLPSDLKALDKQIEQKIDGIDDFTDIEKIKEYKNDIITYLNKKSKIIGQNSGKGSAIRQLYEEKALYEQKLNKSTAYIKVPMSGVVSYRVDNFESVLTPNNFNIITKELLESLDIKIGQIIATNNQEGKVINNYECYIATVMNSEDATNSVEGQKVKIRLPSKEEISATIAYKNQENDKDVIIIFKITSNVEELISYRKISLDVIWWSDTGLKVPNSAIINDDNNKSYIIRNRAGYLNKILIKKVKETKGYTLVQNYETEELKQLGYSIEEIQNMKNVTLYDEIVAHPTKEMLQ